MVWRLSLENRSHRVVKVLLRAWINNYLVEKYGTLGTGPPAKIYPFLKISFERYPIEIIRIRTHHSFSVACASRLGCRIRPSLCPWDKHPQVCEESDWEQGLTQFDCWRLGHVVQSRNRLGYYFRTAISIAIDATLGDAIPNAIFAISTKFQQSLWPCWPRNAGSRHCDWRGAWTSAVDPSRGLLTDLIGGLTVSSFQNFRLIFKAWRASNTSGVRFFRFSTKIFFAIDQRRSVSATDPSTK